MNKPIPCVSPVAGALAAVCLFAAGVERLPAGPRYVRPPGTCTNTELQYPYASWADAATNIQWAVDAADFTETVWVSNGQYCVTSQVAITKNIKLKSVAGWTNTLVYADWPAWTTRVFYVARTGEVDGFTISNGHNVTALGGGGAHVASNAVIRNCYFVNNVSTNWANGGGAWVGGGSATTVSNCLFVSNQMFHGRGGGVYLSDGYVLGCTFLSNRADGAYSGYYNWNGGGIHQDGGLISNCYFAFNYTIGMGAAIRGYLRVVDCVISNNTAGTRGGGISEQSASGYVRDCIVVNNRSALGGGLDFQHGNNSVTNCVIAGNSASHGGGGVFVAMNYPNPASTYLSLDSCLISNNLALSYNGGGGIAIDAGGAVLVRNCLIANNTNKSSNGYNGGGIALISSSNHPTRLSGIINCTIVNNWTTNDGGGIAYTAAGANLIPVVNCVFAGNWSSSNLYPQVLARGDNTNLFWNTCAAALLPPAQANITESPAFDATGWRLGVNSPCVNAGLNQDWMTNAPDLAGQKRIFYGTVDMGAFERIYSGTLYHCR